MPHNDYPAIAVVGPTASGKTGLALALARRFHGEILSCDALQVYRGMDIGTAKASAAERAAVRHHLLDIRDPDQDFSAGDFMELGRAALRDMRARKVTPLVVGGTGFYLRALIEGLFEGPGRSEETRARIRRILERKGGRERIRAALERADPAAAAQIQPADMDRTIRALEVWWVSGRPMSWWQQQPRDRLEGCRWLKLGISWPREQLYARIDRRVDGMMRAGFADEVRRLRERYPAGLHAFKAIGYRQILACLEGDVSPEAAVEEAKRESRRYAKRQLTWFRSDSEIIWLEGPAGADQIFNEASARSESFLAGAVTKRS